MATPSLPDIYPNSIGDEIYAGLQPLIDAYGDPEQHLWIYCHALGMMLKQVDDICCDGPDGEPGWSQIFDLTRAKTEWLPWVGQLVGYQVPERPVEQSFEDYDLTQRERIITRSAYRRGTIDQMRAVIAEQLNPPKRVIVQERYGGNPYQMKIWVYEDDIKTSEAEILQAANRQKVAGLILEIGFLEGHTYDELRANSASYQIVKNKFANYQEVLLDPGKA